MFGSPSGSGSTRADVTFRANIGQFRADVSEARQIYQRSTGQMSDAALRMAVAQEKLDRSIHKYGAESLQAKQVTVAWRNEMRSLQTQADRTEREVSQTSRSLERASRGALAGSGAFRSLRGSIAFASASFLGGAGLIYGIRQAISAASNLEEQQNATRVVFRASARDVLDWSKTTAGAMGIASDRALEYAGSIGGIANASGLTRKESADLSKSIVQLAADLASAKNADPSDMLERLRSGLVGEAEPLRRYGVLLSAARVEQEAYRLGLAKVGDELSEGQKVQARYSLILKDTADFQGDYARTADSLANSQRTLSALWREASILVGQALAPSFTEVVQGARDWLREDKNRAELQRTVNQLVSDGEKVVRGFAAGLKLVKEAAEPVVGAVGGVANAVEIATVLWATFKAKALLSFAATAVASRVTAARMAADAAFAGRAWDAATRPRVMSVTTVGGGLTKGGLARGALAFVGLTPGTAILTGAALLAYFGIRSGQRGVDYDKLKRAAQTGNLTYAQLDQLSEFLSDAQESELRGLIARANARRGRGGRITDAGDRSDAGRAPGESGRDGGDGARPRRTLDDVELDLSRAGTTGDTADDARYLREKRALLERQMRFLERRQELGKLTKEQQQKLRQVYGELASVQSQLDSIAADGERKLEERRERAAAARQAERERVQAAIRARIERRETKLTIAQELAEATKKDLLDDKTALVELRRFYGLQAGNDDLTLKERQEFAAKRRDVRRRLHELNEQAVADAIEDEKLTARERQRLRRLGGSSLVRQAEREMRRSGRSGSGGEEGITREQVESMQFEFLQSLQGLFNEFGGNLFPEGTFDDMGRVGTHAAIQTELLRDQNRTLEHLAAGARQPASRYGYRVLTSAFDGYSF